MDLDQCVYHIYHAVWVWSHRIRLVVFNKENEIGKKKFASEPFISEKSNNTACKNSNEQNICVQFDCLRISCCSIKMKKMKITSKR